MLRDVSIEILSGGTVAVVGSTDSGNTTIMKLLPSIHDCTVGAVSLDGADLRE